MTSGVVDDPRGLVTEAASSQPPPSVMGRKQRDLQLQGDNTQFEMKKTAGGKENANANAAPDGGDSKEVMTFDEFINGTSFHGVRYIFDPRFYVIRR